MIIQQDTTTIAFIQSFEEIQTRVAVTADEKGWWDKERSIGELIALMHSELSEALEYARVGDSKDDKIPNYTGVEAEFADLIIRVMDTAHHLGFRVAEAIIAKMQYNRTREVRHGGKLF